jgi:hypothetical protein
VRGAQGWPLTLERRWSWLAMGPVVRGTFLRGGSGSATAECALLDRARSKVEDALRYPDRGFAESYFAWNGPSSTIGSRRGGRPARPGRCRTGSRTRSSTMTRSATRSRWCTTRAGDVLKCQVISAMATLPDRLTISAAGCAEVSGPRNREGSVRARRRRARRSCRRAGWAPGGC